MSRYSLENAIENTVEESSNTLANSQSSSTAFPNLPPLDKQKHLLDLAQNLKENYYYESLTQNHSSNLSIDNLKDPLTKEQLESHLSQGKTSYQDSIGAVGTLAFRSAYIEELLQIDELLKSNDSVGVVNAERKSELLLEQAQLEKNLTLLQDHLPESRELDLTLRTIEFKEAGRLAAKLDVDDVKEKQADSLQGIFSHVQEAQMNIELEDHLKRALENNAGLV